jgi:hypothetical protein
MQKFTALAKYFIFNAVTIQNEAYLQMVYSFFKDVDNPVQNRVECILILRVLNQGRGHFIWSRS